MEYVLHCPDIVRYTFYIRLTLSRPYPYIWSPLPLPAYSTMVRVLSKRDTNMQRRVSWMCFLNTALHSSVVETRKFVFGPNMKVWLVCKGTDFQYSAGIVRQCAEYTHSPPSPDMSKMEAIYVEIWCHDRTSRAEKHIFFIRSICEKTTLELQIDC